MGLALRKFCCMKQRLEEALLDFYGRIESGAGTSGFWWTKLVAQVLHVYWWTK